MIPAAEVEAIQREFGAVFLQNFGTVYGEDEPTGRFTIVLGTRLDCWLTTVGNTTAQSVDQRRELAERQVLHYDPAYTLPESCQIEVPDPSAHGALQRFNPVTGTEMAKASPSGVVIDQWVDVVRVKA